jgi:hypothetical protein
MYNMMNGFNPACVFIMPMLGRKQAEWPRFRDCWVTEENNIAIYTRVGGGNRNQGYGEEQLYEDPNFITTYDDEDDNTYATYEFKVPEKWKADFDLILEGKVTEISEEYKTYLKEFFPKLTEDGFFNQLFNQEDL